MVQDQEQGSIATAEEAAPQEISPDVILGNLARAVTSGGSWFYWIAGLSLVNTVIAMFNGDVMFVLGLGATQIVNEIIRELQGIATIIGLLVNVAIAGVYVLFGYCACQRMKWAFIVGMVLYSFDAVIFLLVKDWLPFGFHLFALYCIFKGMKALGLYRQVEAEVARQQPLAQG